MTRLKLRPRWQRVLLLPVTFFRHLRVSPTYPLMCWRIALLTVRF